MGNIKTRVKNVLSVRFSKSELFYKEVWTINFWLKRRVPIYMTTYIKGK